MTTFSEPYLQKIGKIRQAGSFKDFSSLSNLEIADRLRRWSFFHDEYQGRSLLELERLVQGSSIADTDSDRLRDRLIELPIHEILALDKTRSLIFDASNFYAEEVPPYEFEAIVSTVTELANLSNQCFQPEAIVELCEGLIQFTWHEKTYRLAIAGACDDLLLTATQLNSILKSIGYQYYQINFSPDVQIVMLTESEKDEWISDAGFGIYEDNWRFVEDAMDEPFYQCLPGEVTDISANTITIQLASDRWDWGTIDLASQIVPVDLQGVGEAVDLIFQYHYPIADQDEPIESLNAIATFEGCSLIQVFPKMESIISYYHPHLITPIRKSIDEQLGPEADLSPDLSSLRPIEQMMLSALRESEESSYSHLQFRARERLQLLGRCQQITLLETGQFTSDIEELAQLNQLDIKELEDYSIQIRFIKPDLVQHMAIAQKPKLKSYVLLLTMLSPFPDDVMTQSLLCESIEATMEEPSDGGGDGFRLIPPTGYC
jgi:hypothetical protein